MTSPSHTFPQFLGVIEFRASEIMQQYSALFPNGRPDPGPGNYSSRPGTTSLNLASSLGGGSPSLSAMLGTPTGLNTSRKSPFKFGAGEGASSPSTDPVAKFKAGSLGPRFVSPRLSPFLCHHIGVFCLSCLCYCDHRAPAARRRVA